MASAPRTVRDLSDHPAVYVVSNETATQDGYWVYLKPGYVWDGTTSHVHEPTVKACCEAMAGHSTRAVLSSSAPAAAAASALTSDSSDRSSLEV